MGDTSVHQYIDRETGQVMTEPLFRNGCVRFLYSSLRENARWCFNLLTSSRSTALLGYMNFDHSFNGRKDRVEAFLREMGINGSDCVDRVDTFETVRQVFERKIRFWDVRPMSREPWDIVSPCDARVLVGSMNTLDSLFIKGKYFTYPELLGNDRQSWSEEFSEADFAVFRLTPDQYHYNHVPVSGTVADIYEVNGRFHSCNPGAVIREVTPYSKNQRVVTVIDTDVDSGTGVGLVAMIEVTAMMIGRVDQCYSDHGYDSPMPVTPGMTLKKGQPKSLFRPGSSTVILLFQKNRTAFCPDIVDNMFRHDAQSLFARGFKRPIVETGVRVRETLGQRTQRIRARDAMDDGLAAPGNLGSMNRSGLDGRASQPDCY
ncbi:MAG: phosphatidylserine decarboxylase [Pseudomonadota bacterium]